jgi:hypothetical protein
MGLESGAEMKVDLDMALPNHFATIFRGETSLPNAFWLRIRRTSVLFPPSKSLGLIARQARRVTIWKNEDIGSSAI